MYTISEGGVGKGFDIQSFDIENTFQFCFALNIFFFFNSFCLTQISNPFLI